MSYGYYFFFKNNLLVCLFELVYKHAMLVVSTSSGFGGLELALPVLKVLSFFVKKFVASQEICITSYEDMPCFCAVHYLCKFYFSSLKSLFASFNFICTPEDVFQRFIRCYKLCDCIKNYVKKKIISSGVVGIEHIEI